ncbi:MAG TPA: NAD(P)-dependent oxidoreductase [Streptosporangiaceae bacterium]|jgi:nucleoside-diphosphate-sugar epimerase|nr:NAD(P)-dependent oxidoreductase [Streptosporangiaceae bacterium]
MRVFLAGGAGVIGRSLIPLLTAAGHQVTATTRTPAKAGLLRSLGAQAGVVDGLDRAAVHEAVARAQPDVIIHQMTALSGSSDLRNFDKTFAVTNELRTRGTDYLLEAGRATGAGRFIAQSFTGWPNIRAGGPVKTEDDPLDPAPPGSMAESFRAIQHLEAAVSGARSPDGIVLRYGSLYGPGASDEMVGVVRKRRMPIVGDGSGVWSFIHVADAASATAAAVERGAPGIYNIVDDDPAPVAEWLPYLAACIGARPPWRVPAWAGRLLAGESVTSLMTQIRGSSNAKARRELGWTPAYGSWRAGFAAGLGGEEHGAGDPGGTPAGGKAA